MQGDVNDLDQVIMQEMSDGVAQGSETNTMETGSPSGQPPEPIVESEKKEANPSVSGAEKTIEEKPTSGTQEGLIDLGKMLGHEEPPIVESTVGTTSDKAIGDFASAEALHEAYQQIVSENARIQEQLKTSPFYDDRVKGLNDYLSKGGDFTTYAKVQSMDLDKMDSRSLIKAKLMWENPTVSEEHIDAKIDYDYKVNKSEFDEDQDDPESARMVAARLAFDASTAKKYLEEVKVKELTPRSEVLKEQARQSEMARVQAWERPLSGISFAKLSLTVGDQQLQYSVPPSIQTQVKQVLSGMISETPEYQATPENVSALADYGMQLVKGQLFDKIVPSLYQKAVADSKLEAFKGAHNTSKPQQVQAPGVNMPEDNSLDAQIMKELGQR